MSHQATPMIGSRSGLASTSSILKACFTYPQTHFLHLRLVFQMVVPSVF